MYQPAAEVAHHVPYFVSFLHAVNVSSVTEVRGGRNTDSFKISSSANQPEELCFSVIYIDGKDTKMLDLVAVSEEDRKAWVEGLKALIREEGEVIVME